MSVKKLDLKQGWTGWGGLGRRDFSTSPPGTGPQGCVSSGRDMAADGSLRASQVGGTGLRQGWFAPEPPSKVLGRQRGVFRESPVYANQCGDE